MYPDNWREIWSVHELSRRWAKSGVISEDEQNRIEEFYPLPFRSTNIVLATAVAAFTVIVTTSFLILLLMLSESPTRVFSSFFPWLLSIAIGFAASLIVSKLKHMHTGIDDGLSLALVITVLVAQVLSFEDRALGGESTAYFFYLLVAAIVSASKFRTLLTLLVLLTAILLLTLDVMFHILRLGPLAGMVGMLVLSGGAEYVLLLIRQRYQTRWRGRLDRLEYVLLALVVLASNYFIVFSLSQPKVAREGLSNLPILFYVVTLTVPAGMTVLGFLWTNLRMIRVGTIGILQALTTFRYHFFTEALEAFLIVGGLCLVVLVLITQRMLEGGIGRYVNHPILTSEHHELGEVMLTGTDTAIAGPEHSSEMAPLVSKAQSPHDR